MKKLLGRLACWLVGHVWDECGGRACPKNVPNCSQRVYRCRLCGQWDYGNPGGPAWDECDSCDEEPPEE